MDSGNFNAVDLSRMNTAEKMMFNKKAREAGNTYAVDTSIMNGAELYGFNGETVNHGIKHAAMSQPGNPQFRKIELPVQVDYHHDVKPYNFND